VTLESGLEGCMGFQRTAMGKRKTGHGRSFPAEVLRKSCLVIFIRECQGEGREEEFQ
jgi:hypothetical protein